MLTKITAYSQWGNVDPLVLNVIDRPETDVLEVRDIQGLEAVKADVNTTPKGLADGSFFTGSNIGERNIVLTLGLSPDWDNWTMSSLRRFLNKYFFPKMLVNLHFETQEFAPVQISGYVESNESNMFSKDPEHQISIICPDLYFQAISATTISGSTDEPPVAIDYQGDVESGINVVATKYSGADATQMGVRIMDPQEASISATKGGAAVLPAGKTFVVDTNIGKKKVQQVTLMGGAKVNLLNYTDIVRRWPVVGPGTETFEVFSDTGVQHWTLTYYDRFGSL